MRWYQRLCHRLFGWNYALLGFPFAETVVRVRWHERGYITRPWEDPVWLLLPSGAVATGDTEFIAEGWYWHPLTFPPVSAEQHAAMGGRV